MWLKIKRKTELSIPELTMFLSPAGGEGPSIEDSLLSPTLCWRQVQPWGQFVQSQICKKEWRQQQPQLQPRSRASRALLGSAASPWSLLLGNAFPLTGFNLVTQ